MAEEEGIEVVEEASIKEGVEEVLVLVPELAKEKRRGDGFIVEGGRSPSTSSKDGEDGGVANKSSMGSRLVVTSEWWRDYRESCGASPMYNTRLMVERMVDKEEMRFLDC
ncbi:hypothetical protein Tco_0348847 [Tanacetum coccineum]